MTNEKHNDKEASFDGTGLEELTNHVKGILDIQDRTYGIPPKKYAMCFVGSEAVETLVREMIANDEVEVLKNKTESSDLEDVFMKLVRA